MDDQPDGGTRGNGVFRANRGGLMRQLSLFSEGMRSEKLPTNLTTRQHPIHRWFNFIAGFSPEFVSRCIREAALGSNDILIDPFAGLSTALVQANLEGIRSVGFEVHPFFFDISLAKLEPPRCAREVDLMEALGKSVEAHAGDLGEVWTPSALAYLAKLIPEGELRLLASTLMLEPRVSPSLRPLFRLIFSRVLELTARSQTDGIYKAPTTRKVSTPFSVALKKVCSEIREDVGLLGRRFDRLATLFQKSSERMDPVSDRSCSLCVTSPPYLNNFDFAEMTRMELYYWRYAGSWSEITQRIRRHLVVNTTTAPTDLKRDQASFLRTLSHEIRSELDPVVKALRRQRGVRPGKKDYYLLVYPYFSQMQEVIREVRRVLRPRTSFHLVVGDAALYGVHIRTERFLAKLMEENGFRIIRIETFRTRGYRWILEKRQGANTPLGEFHIHAKRA